MNELEKFKEEINGLSLAELLERIIIYALQIGAIKVRPKNPFTWASGFQMPIYDDNRMLLFDPKIRTMVTYASIKTIENVGINVEFIAGTSTAGIPWAGFLAQEMWLPMAYIRDKPKDHGLKNLIEGLDSEKDFGGADVVVIEDLISTGASSAKAVQAALDAKGNVKACISIFNYGFPQAQKLFAELNPPCEVASLITYPMLLKKALEIEYLTREEIILLENWSDDPFSWGEKNGFPKIIK